VLSQRDRQRLIWIREHYRNEKIVLIDVLLVGGLVVGVGKANANNDPHAWQVV
jgi:hypothetical protein